MLRPRDSGPTRWIVEIMRPQRRVSQLAFVLVSTLVLMTLYETTKSLLFPSLTLWGSHLVTIFVSCIIATMATSWVLQRLQQGEDSYSRFVEMSPEAVWIHRQGTVIIANKACAALFGAASPEKLLGKNVLDFTHPEDREMVRTRMQNHPVDPNLVRHYESKHLRMDGGEINAEVVVCSILYQGETASLAVFHNIGERREAEWRLRESEAKLAAAQRVAQLGSWSLELKRLDQINENPLHWSDEVYRIFGYEVGQIEPSKENFLRLVHPEDRAHLNDETARAIRERTRYSLEFRVNRPDGAQRIVQAQANTIFDEKTKMPLRFVGTVQDVTERKQAEEKLARMALIVESSDDAIIGLTPGGRIASWNKGAERTYGYSESEVVGQHITILAPPDRSDEVAKIKERVRRGEGIPHFETVRLRKGGQPIDVSLTISPVKDPTGRVIGIASVSRDITERKHAEEKLARMALIVESSDDAIASVALDGAINSWNSGAERVYGYSESEAIGQPITILSPPDRPGEIQQILERLLQGESVQGFETVRIRKGGQPIDVSLTITPVRDPSGKIIGSAAVARDITAHRREEDRSRRLAQLVDSATELISTGDRDGRITFMNQAFLRAIGWSEKEVLGKYFQDVVLSPGISPGLREQILTGITEKGGWKGECLHRRKDGTDFPVYLSVGPLRDGAGCVIGNVAIVRDLTESKRAEERFYKAFHLNPEPITIATVSEGRYLDVNESFLRITGYRRDEVIGRTSLDVRFWERLEDRTTLIETLRQQGSVRDLEITFRTKSGEQRTALDSADIIEVNGQKCIIAILKDITERKALEKQLRQLQKMEAVGQLSGGVAHDFNNLLGVILGYSEILEEGLSQNSRLLKTAREITKAGQRAASLTRQLLAFSRQQLLEPTVLDLNSVVTETAKMLRRLIGEHIEITSKLAADLGHVKADQSQIEQVVMNLALNARDAMPDGGKLIFETRNVELDEDYALHHPPTVPGKYVELIVADTGVGMDSQTQSHIFEPFFTTKERGKGTGLGLATVYGVVKQSGGYIWVYSEPGVGSTFRVYLPLASKAGRQNTPGEAAAPAQGSETILLVEDEESLRTLTRTMLERCGYTVLEASSGKEAIEIAQDHASPIDLLLTDMVMPGMSGHEAARAVALARPGIKIVYMSGYTGFSRGPAQPEDILLPKPITRDALLRKVHEVLHLHNAPVA